MQLKLYFPAGRASFLEYCKNTCNVSSHQKDGTVEFMDGLGTLGYLVSERNPTGNITGAGYIWGNRLIRKVVQNKQFTREFIRVHTNNLKIKVL